MFEVIEHLPNPIEFLRRAEAVVKPGGLIYITTPNFNSLDRRVLGSQWNAVHREHLCYFTPRTLLNAIQKQTSLELLHLETRNISEDLIGYIKNIFVSGSRKNGCGLINKNAPLKTPDLRAKIDESQILSLAKLSANQFLNATSLGSTIVMLLRRPEGRPENSVFSESP